VLRNLLDASAAPARPVARRCARSPGRGQALKVEEDGMGVNEAGVFCKIDRAWALCFAALAFFRWVGFRLGPWKSGIIENAG